MRARRAVGARRPPWHRRRLVEHRPGWLLGTGEGPALPRRPRHRLDPPRRRRAQFLRELDTGLVPLGHRLRGRGDGAPGRRDPASLPDRRSGTTSPGPLQRADRASGPATALGPRLPPEPMGIPLRRRCACHHRRVREARHPPQRRASRHRLHARLPGLHGGPRPLPRSGSPGRPRRGHGRPVGDDRRPRRQGGPRLRRVPRRAGPAPVLHRRPRAHGRGCRVAGAQRLPRFHRPRDENMVGRASTAPSPTGASPASGTT